MTISASLRFEILRRDKHTCMYCGAKAPEVELTVDHVMPSALGGSDDPSNLVTACKDCNAGKGSTPPDAAKVAEVDADAIRYRDAMERAAEQIRAQKAVTDLLTDRFEEFWDSYTYGPAHDRSKVPKPGNVWRQTILNYVERGLPADSLFDNICIAMDGPASPADTWKYFCGVCRRQVEQITEAAIKIMAEEQRAATREAIADSTMDWIAEMGRNMFPPPVLPDDLDPADADPSNIDWSDYGQE